MRESVPALTLSLVLAERRLGYGVAGAQPFTRGGGKVVTCPASGRRLGLAILAGRVKGWNEAGLARHERRSVAG